MGTALYYSGETQKLRIALFNENDRDYGMKQRDLYKPFSLMPVGITQSYTSASCKKCALAVHY